jgi:hypothetical protein
LGEKQAPAAVAPRTAEKQLANAGLNFASSFQKLDPTFLGIFFPSSFTPPFPWRRLMLHTDAGAAWSFYSVESRITTSLSHPSLMRHH